MRKHASILLFAVVAAALVAAPLSPAAAEGGPSFKDVEKVVKDALKAEDPTVRARAFEILSDSTDLRAVGLIISSMKQVKRSQETIRREQQSIEEQFEEQFNKKLKLDAWFENSSRSSKDLDRFNGAARKITRKLNLLTVKLSTLEDDFTRASALLDSAVMVMARVVGNLSTDDFNKAMDKLNVQWRDHKNTEAQLWWIDTLASLDRPSISSRIRSAVHNPELPVEVRAAALQTLGAKDDVTAYDEALPHVEVQTDWHMTAAAIQVLKMLRQKRGIEPLIEFLGRKDLQRLREDAHEALKSLTAEKHGPYKEPWARWWEENRDTFTIPKAPDGTGGTERGAARAPGETVTFYGVQSFSDRILFILDVSGSMDQVPKGPKEEGPKKPKIDVARRELIGAIDNQDDGHRFNVIFFNHQVVPWQTKMIESTDATRRRARKWIEKQEPQGGTNIHDALEAGFAMALRVTGDPIIDTVFFLTDGRPTAGKIQDPEQILAHVAEWNRTARVTIHAIGVGDHDQEFMEKLAKIGGGKYVRK